MYILYKFSLKFVKKNDSNLNYFAQFLNYEVAANYTQDLELFYLLRIAMPYF